MATSLTRRLDTGASARRIDLGARVQSVRSDQDRDSAARAALYASPRWRRERREFLKVHPICCTVGCGNPSQVVDHSEGHHDQAWRDRFWDKSLWQPLCLSCHGAKSARELAAWRQTGGMAPAR